MGELADNKAVPMITSDTDMMFFTKEESEDLAMKYEYEHARRMRNLAKEAEAEFWARAAE